MVKKIALTGLCLLLTAAGVIATTYFLIEKLAVPPPYWIVPIFGSLGGVIGGILRRDGSIFYCEFRDDSIELGIVADILLGLGGSSAALFLFAGTLQFDPDKPSSFMLLAAVSVIAGVFGRRVLELAGSKLLDIARKEARNEAKRVTNTQVAEPAALTYANEARYMISGGNFEAALTLADAALERDPEFAGAYIEKGRALHRLERTNDALEAVEEARKRAPTHPTVLYNRACYNSVLGAPSEQIIDDLDKAFTANPRLKPGAKDDIDLERIRQLPEFQQLVLDND